MSDALSPALARALEESWPAAEYAGIGGFRVGRGLGGGRRVSAAVAEREDWQDSDIARVVEQQRGWDQEGLIRATPGSRLSQHLLAEGWQAEALTHVMTLPSQSLTDTPIPPVTCFTVWPPLAIQEELWTERGIGAARQAVMARVTLPKVAILGRSDDRAGGVAFAAASDGIAVIHAVEIIPSLRRRGLAGWMMREAAFWASDQGCETLALAVTDDNSAAIALYDELGFTRAGRYEYYRPGPSGTA